MRRDLLKAELAEDGLHPNDAGYKIMAPLAEGGDCEGNAITERKICDTDTDSLSGRRNAEDQIREKRDSALHPPRRASPGRTSRAG
jgi:hypothetical protein